MNKIMWASFPGRANIAKRVKLQMNGWKVVLFIYLFLSKANWSRRIGLGGGRAAAASNAPVISAGRH